MRGDDSLIGRASLQQTELQSSQLLSVPSLLEIVESFPEFSNIALLFHNSPPKGVYNLFHSFISPLLRAQGLPYAYGVLL